jgi:hypothetical protein
MSSKAETLDVNLDIVQPVEWFPKCSYRRFPVLRDGRMVDQISRADVQRAMAEQWNGDRGD